MKLNVIIHFFLLDNLNTDNETENKLEGALFQKYRPPKLHSKGESETWCFAFCSSFFWLHSFLCFFGSQSDPLVPRSKRRKLLLPHFPSPHTNAQTKEATLYTTTRTSAASAYVAGSRNANDRSRQQDWCFKCTQGWLSVLGPSLLCDPCLGFHIPPEEENAWLELSCLLRNSLGATSFSSRFPAPRSFFARHRTAMVSSTLAKDTCPSTVLLPRRRDSVMMFETLLAKTVHEVSLLHLERM